MDSRNYQLPLRRHRSHAGAANLAASIGQAKSGVDANPHPHLDTPMGGGALCDLLHCVAASCIAYMADTRPFRSRAHTLLDRTNLSATGHCDAEPAYFARSPGFSGFITPNLCLAHYGSYHYNSGHPAGALGPPAGALAGFAPTTCFPNAQSGPTTGWIRPTPYPGAVNYHLHGQNSN